MANEKVPIQRWRGELITHHTVIGPGGSMTIDGTHILGEFVLYADHAALVEKLLGALRDLVEASVVNRNAPEVQRARELLKEGEK